MQKLYPYQERAIQDNITSMLKRVRPDQPDAPFLKRLLRSPITLIRRLHRNHLISQETAGHLMRHMLLQKCAAFNETHDEVNAPHAIIDRTREVSKILARAQVEMPTDRKLRVYESIEVDDHGKNQRFLMIFENIEDKKPSLEPYEPMFVTLPSHT